MKKTACATKVNRWNRVPKGKHISTKRLASAAFGVMAIAIISMNAHASPSAANKNQPATGNHGSTVITKTADRKAVLHAQTIVNQVPSNLTPGAKAASDRYEALEHGHPLPGTNQTDLLMHGYVPPGMSSQQAQVFYNALPNSLKRPYMPQPGTPEWVSRMAHEPADPSSPAFQSVGISGDRIEATNQKLIKESIRDRFGAIYIPPLHREHNRGPDAASSANSVPHLYTREHFGSIREMTDSSGNIVAQYAYDPYGRQTLIAGTGPQSDFGYNGTYVHQRSGLLMMGARFYNPTIGRFLNRDPIEESGGVNLFEYAGNDPINRFDPTGTATIQYGNWGGPGWTNGKNQSEISNFPYLPGQSGFKTPTNPRDRCYYWHDVCLHNCARIGSKDPKVDKKRACDRNRCRRNCDEALASCLQNVSDTFGPWQFGPPPLTPGEIQTFTPPGSPNDNPGEFVPGLRPYKNVDPGVLNPGTPQ